MSERHQVALIDGSLWIVWRNNFTTMIAIRRNHATYRRSVVRWPLLVCAFRDTPHALQPFG
jgi:hypothetical protein